MPISLLHRLHAHGQKAGGRRWTNYSGKRVLWYHTNMRQSISKHEILAKLQKIVNSKEGLWWKMRDLAKTDGYLIISDDYGKILKKLDMLEAELGATKEITALREAIVGQASPDCVSEKQSLSLAKATSALSIPVT